mgnify:CR=1 FL=1
MFSFFDDFLSLFFPPCCEVCGEGLISKECLICTSCIGHLPYTDWHKGIDNPLQKVFWGKISARGVTAMFYFHQGGRVQKMLHKLKYKGVKELGVYLGELYGMQLKKAFPFSEVDLIVPVPLHPKRQKKRGYNQSEQFANGIALSMGIKVITANLIRKKPSQTQTKKTKIQRWENVKDIFEIKNPEQFVGKHILIVDDVITTGSTLESCGKILLEISDVSISVAAIAAAHR